MTAKQRRVRGRKGRKGRLVEWQALQRTLDLTDREGLWNGYASRAVGEQRAQDGNLLREVSPLQHPMGPAGQLDSGSLSQTLGSRRCHSNCSVAPNRKDPFLTPRMNKGTEKFLLL